MGEAFDKELAGMKAVKETFIQKTAADLLAKRLADRPPNAFKQGEIESPQIRAMYHCTDAIVGAISLLYSQQWDADHGHTGDYIEPNTLMEALHEKLVEIGKEVD
jgi:hypothetical protein